MRLSMLFLLAGLLPGAAHAMTCSQADPRQARSIFEQGEYALGANPLHVRLKAALPIVTVNADQTCIADFPIYTWENKPAGHFVAGLEVAYAACVQTEPPPWHQYPRGTPGTCPYIHLKMLTGA